MIPQFLLKLLFGQDILSQTGPGIAVRTECDWLRIVYQKMGGNVLDIPRDCCKMYGVRCRNGDVTSINWINQALTGSIPSEIRHLVNLQSL